MSIILIPVIESVEFSETQKGKIFVTVVESEGDTEMCYSDNFFSGEV